MFLLPFLECVVVSAWIKKGRESVESLDRNVASLVVWEMRWKSRSVLQAGVKHPIWERILCIQHRCVAGVEDL